MNINWTNWINSLLPAALRQGTLIKKLFVACVSPIQTLHASLEDYLGERKMAASFNSGADSIKAAILYYAQRAGFPVSQSDIRVFDVNNMNAVTIFSEASNHPTEIRRDRPTNIYSVYAIEHERHFKVMVAGLPENFVREIVERYRLVGTSYSITILAQGVGNVPIGEFTVA